MAACLLTDRVVHADQRAAHRRRRGDGAAAARPRRRGRRASAARRCASSAATSPRTNPTAPWSGRLRGSVLLLGPLLARRGRAHVAPPGGDFPARRTIQTHLEALTAMGAHAWSTGTGHRLEAPDGLKPASIYLDEASVTGTETALLAAAAAPGVSEIRHAACEPHVVELCEFLRGMGVGVTGEGSHTIRVEGVACGSRRAEDALRRLHRGRQLGGGRRHHRRPHRDRRHAPGRHGSGRVGAAQDARAVRAGRRRVPRRGLASWSAPDASRPGCGRVSRATSSAW